MLKKFNVFCEEILKEYRCAGRINLSEKDHELIIKIAKELRKPVSKSLLKTGEPRIDGYDCGSRFYNDERQILDVESYITEDKELQDQLLVPIDDATSLKRELKDDESILPKLNELVEKALEEAASADYWYNYEKDWN